MSSPAAVATWAAMHWLPSGVVQVLGPAFVAPLLLGPEIQRGQPAPSDDNLVAAGWLPLAIQLRPDHKGLKQPLRLGNPCAWMDAARASMPELAPMRRTLAGQGISLARLMSVVVVVTGAGGHRSLPFVVARRRLGFPGGRVSGGAARGGSGFAGTLLHGAGAQQRRKEAG